MRFEGSMVALVTPMKNGTVDLGALRELVEWQLQEGTDGILPCATTGEGVTLKRSERAEVVKAVLEVVKKRVPVIAGAGSSATYECIESVGAMKELGVDAVLVATPSYNKPTQEGLYRHYSAIFDATRFPIVAYNVPSRTAGDLLPETTARLAKAGAIVGLKDATANMDRQIQLQERIGRDAISFLSGDDFTVLPYIACGGHGVVSVVGNVVPRRMKELVVAARKDELTSALEKQVAMAEVNRAMFIETNPGPAKAALHMMGKIGPEIRLPLVPVSETNLPKIRDALVRFGISLA